MVGVIIAVFYIEVKNNISINIKQIFVAKIASIFLVFLIWGYQGPYKFYEFVGMVLDVNTTSTIILYNIAAIILMVFGLYDKKTKLFFNKKIGNALGKISFPVYLTHLIVICSISSWAYLYLITFLPIFMVLCMVFILTAIFTAIASWYLSKIDILVTRHLDRWMTKLFIQ